MMNVAVAMENAGAREQAQEILAELQANPAANALMEAAKTVEDMYEVAKSYVDMSLEAFRNAFAAAMDYCNDSKQELDDDAMECIVGGSWGDAWNMFKKVALATVIIAGVAAACAITGGAAGAALGAAGAWMAGTSVATAATTAATTGAIGGCALGVYNTVKEACS